MRLRVPDKAVRVGIKNLLIAVTYAGQPVNFYSEEARPGADYPRIIIRNINSNQQGSKSQFMYDVSFDLAIEDRRINVTNTNPVDEIADEVTGLLLPAIQGENFPVQGFRVINVNLTGSNINTYEVTPHKYADKNLRITIKLEQDA